MAFNAGTQWSVRADGSETICAGGFNPQNTNMATDGAATSATGNSAVFSSASYNFVAGDVGHWVFIKSGTNWNPGWYQIASVASNVATLSSAIGDGVVFPGANLTTNFALMKATTVAGVATVASPTSATWSVDYSQSAAAFIAYTDMVIGGTTTQYTSAANPVGKNKVGNHIRVTSGTGFTVQTVEIVSTSGTTATCDKSLGTGGSTGGNGYLGGSYRGPQLLMALPVIAGNTVWCKAGAYTWSSATSNGTLGRTTVVSATQCIGFNSKRGDDSTTRPIFSASGSASGYCFTGGTFSLMKNLEVDLLSLSGAAGFNHNTSDLTWNSKVSNVNSGQISFLSGTQIYCIAEHTTPTGIGFSGGGDKFMCVAKNMTTGFNPTVSGFTTTNCVATTCTTGWSGGVASAAHFCLAYNTTNGFVVTGNSSYYLYGCIAATASSRGFDANTGAFILVSCGAHNCTTADTRFNSSGTAPSSVIGFITITADPFTNAAGGNFALNNTAGGGALLRGLSLAYPATISTTTYRDVGPAQHQDAGSAATVAFTFS